MLSAIWRYAKQHHVALIALFVVFGGTAYAVKKNSVDSRAIENNSVKSKDLKNNKVKGKDVRKGTLESSDVSDGSLTGEDVADGSLLAGDLAPGVLPNGPSPAGAVVTRYTEFTVNATSFSGQTRAECLPGERAVGGGIGLTGSPGSTDAVVYTNPSRTDDTFPNQGATPNAWDGSYWNGSASQRTGRVYVVCASG